MLRSTANAGLILIKRLPTLVMANVTAVILSAPLAVVVIVSAPRSSILIGLTAITVLVGLLPNPVTAGLHYLTFQFFNTPILVTIWDQFFGLRTYFVQALKLWLVALPVTGLLFASIVFYGRLALIGPLLQAVVACISFFWVGVLFYLYPLLLAQEDTAVRTTYRNALLLTVGQPYVTFPGVFIWLLVLAAGTVTGFFAVVGLAAAAVVQHAATRQVLSRVKVADDRSTQNAQQ